MSFFLFSSGFRFPIKELGDSSRVVKFCVDKRDTNLAIRYDYWFVDSITFI